MRELSLLSFVSSLVMLAGPCWAGQDRGSMAINDKEGPVAALRDSAEFRTASADTPAGTAAAEPGERFGQEMAGLPVRQTNIALSGEHLLAFLRMQGGVPPSAGASPRSSEPLRIRIEIGRGSKEVPPWAQRTKENTAAIAKRLNAEIAAAPRPITSESIAGSRLIYLLTPSDGYTEPEKAAIVDFVRDGGSLLLVLDEERRQSLAATGVNDIIAPFGMKLTSDTEYVHNCGAVAKAGEINAADREIPYSGGRAVEGGTPFAWRLDKDGRVAEPFASWKKLDSGGRIVVMGEAMASIFLGTAEGQRLSGVPRDPGRTTFWGKDSVTFMEEVLGWLVRR